MSVYEFAAYTWTAIVGAGLLAALGAVMARETAQAVECVRRERDSVPASEPSWPSRPSTSPPSCPGI